MSPRANSHPVDRTEAACALTATIRPPPHSVPIELRTKPALRAPELSVPRDFIPGVCLPVQSDTNASLKALDSTHCHR